MEITYEVTETLRKGNCIRTRDHTFLFSWSARKSNWYGWPRGLRLGGGLVSTAVVIVSKIRAVFQNRSLSKTVSFDKQITSMEKYMSIFWHKIEVIVFIILQIFCHARKNERNVCERLTVCCLGGASSSSATIWNKF